SLGTAPAALLNRPQESAKTGEETGLSGQIKNMVAKITETGKRLVFMIDDLDRYHEPSLIVNFLEEIQLVLCLKRCLFFICADKEQMVRAVETRFKESGEAYLDKLVQLPFELPPHQSSDLVNMLAIESPEIKTCFLRIAELYPHSPRKLKAIWNQAVMGLAVVKSELDRVQGFRHEPSITLMLKWLLLKSRGVLARDPYRYLVFEARANGNTADEHLQQEFLLELGFQYQDKAANECQWHSDFKRRLAVFLWHDLKRHRFGSPRVLSLYANISGKDLNRSRLSIEEARFAGRTKIERQDFSNAVLSSGYFSGLHFIDCDFSFADLNGTDLEGAVFERCQLRGVRFDGARLQASLWLACDNLEHLDTRPDTYELIAAQAVKTWQEQAPADWSPEPLYKMYKTILNRYVSPPNEAVRQRLIEKGMQVRQAVMTNYE
ncbi:MAG: hypothetical protein GY862_31690, partial [Gammaproteobacteria bacterium]|nr:hypothetical protein [Gammaproteobacteria bacterium]